MDTAMDALTARILRDVHDGLVTANLDDYIGIPDGIDPPDAENYRLKVVTLLTLSWVMRPMPKAHGKDVLILTSIGERYWWAMNPDRYVSPFSYRADDVTRPERRAVR